MKLVVCGPPGVGKTTVAERLQRRLRDVGLDFRLLHSDDFSRNTYDRMYECVTEAGPADASADPDPRWTRWSGTCGRGAETEADPGTLVRPGNGRFFRKGSDY